MAQQNGDPPDQHVMPGIERVPAPPTVMARTLRNIGVPDAGDTARKISKGGFMLAPAQAPPPRQKSKLSDLELVATTAHAAQPQRHADDCLLERDRAAHLTVLQRGDWTLGRFNYSERTRYFGPRPLGALFCAGAWRTAIVACRCAAMLSPLLLPAPANLGEQPVPPGRIETGSVEPAALAKPIEPEQRARPKVQKGAEQQNLLTDIWRCIGPQGAEPDGAKQKKKSCERATPKF